MSQYIWQNTHVRSWWKTSCAEDEDPVEGEGTDGDDKENVAVSHGQTENDTPKNGGWKVFLETSFDRTESKRLFSEVVRNALARHRQVSDCLFVWYMSCCSVFWLDHYFRFWDSKVQLCLFPVSEGQPTRRRRRSRDHQSLPPPSRPPPHTTPPPSTHVDTPSDENASLASELQKMRQMIMEKDKKISECIVEIEQIKQNHKRKLSRLEKENVTLEAINKRLRDRISNFWMWLQS